MKLAMAWVLVAVAVVFLDFGHWFVALVVVLTAAQMVSDARTSARL